MRIIFLNCILLLVPVFGFSQRIEKNSRNIIVSVEFPGTKKNQPQSEKDFFKTYLNVSEVNDQFVKVPHKSKKLNFVHDHFDQYYKGIKVDGAGYNFHYNKGSMYFANGHYVKIENLDATPSISQKLATDNFINYKGIEKAIVTDTKVELLVKELLNDIPLSVELVYRVCLEANDPSNNEVGFVSAHTGKVVMTEPRAKNIAGTLYTRYNGIQLANTQYVGNDYYRLYDEGTSVLPSVHTQTLNSISIVPSGGHELETNNDNVWTGLPNNNDMAFDVHWGLQVIKNYIYYTYLISSFDDNNYPIEAYVRYGITGPTTNDTKDNSGWDPFYKVLFFGEGYKLFRPMASIDVVGHEYGHGITQFQIGWDNSYERPYLNEGLSDIWGVILEYRIRPDLQTWRMGEEVTLNVPYERNIQNPKDASARVHMADTYMSSTYNNTVVNGVRIDPTYIRSGIFSHWFYLLAKGGSGTNDLGNTYSVAGIGFDNAEKLIAEAVFNNYLDGTATYPDVKTAMINAAKAIFCGDNNKILQVMQAWYAVGVGASSSISGSQLICSKGDYTFTFGDPGDANLVWSANNSNMTLKSTSLNSATFTLQNNYNGQISISATIAGSCNVNVPPVNVWVGKPEINNLSISGISYPYPLCGYGTNISFTAGNIYNISGSASGTSAVNYTVSGTNAGSVSWSAPSPTSFQFFAPANTSFTITARASNVCGYDSQCFPFANVSGGGGGGCSFYTVSPNPSSTTLSVVVPNRRPPCSLAVTAEEEPDLASLPASAPVMEPGTQVKNTATIQSISLYSSDGQVQVTKQFPVDTKQVDIDVSGLRKGIYYLRVSDGKKTESHRVVIN